MNIELEKSYRLLRFLNAPKPRWFKTLFAWGACVYLALLGLPKAFRQDTATLCHEENGIKIAVRRFIWSLHASWVPIQMRSDYFFDVSERLGEPASQALIDWLETNRHISRFECHVWRADIASGLISKEQGEVQKLVLNPGDRLYDYDQAFSSSINEAAQAVGELLHQDVAPAKAIHFRKYKDSFKKDDAYAVLRDARSLLNALDWEWFVISGTFLGAVREQDFLGHDYDLDIGVLYEEFDMEALSHAVETPGIWSIKSSSQCLYRTRRENGQVVYHRMAKPILVKLKHHTGLIVDIFVHIRENGLLWHGSAIHRWNNIDFGVATYRLGNETVKGPDNADRYLTENYGEWRVPVKNFDCSIDTPNIGYSETAKSVSYLLKVAYRFILNGQKQQAERYIDSMCSKGVLERKAGQLIFER